MYNRAFQKWMKFAKDILNVPYLPANPFHVALFFQHLADTASVSAVNSTFYAINWAHVISGFISPTQDQFVVMVKAGIIRRLSLGHPNRKEPLDIQHLKNLGASLDYSDLTQLRNYVMCVIAFAAFIRSSEVINLRRNDIEFEFNHISIYIRKSKTDQLRDGATVLLNELKDVSICPVRLIKRYLEVTNISPASSEYLFRPISGRGNNKRLVTVNKPISYTTYREAFKKLFKDIVPDVSRYSTHSMRAGGATLAINAGVSERQLQRHGRWKSITAKNMYVKDSLTTRLYVSSSMDSAHLSR